MSPSIQKSHLLDIRKHPGLPLQKKVLKDCLTLSFPSPAILKAYHDALLFVMAFPADKESLNIAKHELERVAIFIRDAKGFRWMNALTGTGLPGTEIKCHYSRILLRWLLDTCPAGVKPAGSAADPAAVKAFFQVLLPGVEFKGATAGHLNLWKRVRNLSGHFNNREALEWLVNLTAQQPLPELMKDQLFDGLKIFTGWNLTADGLNRSTLQWPDTKKVYYRTGKKFTPLSLIKRPIKPVKVNQDERNHLITVARASLAFYYRETDPFTYASTAETTCFDMGDGYRIALYGMTAERRLSLDSYIGFLAFKNGLPVAYGGGWIFGHRCKIGVNIYPPFRGADSAFLFTQVLRVYYQQYQVHYFLVKPYQFGRGNTEGIKSGAFWFYYKLGFRPATGTIAGLAKAEWDKIGSDKGYRSSTAVLKKLTGSPLILILKEEGISDPRAAELSARITAMIRDQYGGQRLLAVKEASRHWRKMAGLDISSFCKAAPGTLADWLLLFLLISGRNPRKSDWIKLARLRFNGPEADFIRGWQEKRHLWAGSGR